jgi:mannosyltransferase
MAGPAVADPLTPPAVPETVTPLRERASAFAIRVYWLWPALLTLALSGWKIGTPALWADELATWGAVQLRWGQLFRLANHVDAVVLPYFVVGKVWASVAGTSTVALRLPSAAAMVASAALICVVGSRLAGRWVGLLAGLTFTVVPATSRFAQEARPYAFAVFFAVLATWLLMRYADRPGVRTGLPYALSVAALGAFHLVGLLLLLAHGIVMLRRRQRSLSERPPVSVRQPLRWAAWAGAGVLPALPLVWLGARQSHQIAWIPPAHLHTILAAPDTIFAAGEVGGALIALSVLAFSRQWTVVLLACWALVPTVALAAVAQFTPLFWPRYLLYTMPAWVLLTALTLGRLSYVKAAGVLAAVVLIGAPTQTAIRVADGHGQGTSQAGAVIAAGYRTGDGVAYSLLESQSWVARDVVSHYVPADHRPADVFALTPQRVDGHLAATECSDLTACLDRADPPRMWVVRIHTTADPLAGIGTTKETLLRSRYRLSGLWLTRDLTVALYVRS